jgi:diguanylate cyclase (GGDEF)-like protein
MKSAAVNGSFTCTGNNALGNETAHMHPPATTMNLDHSIYGSAAPMPAPARPDALRHALLDSRQRWRDLVTMASDFAFETDGEGRFVFVSPDSVLGWPSGSLLGRLASSLLAPPQGGFDPFRQAVLFRHQRAWLLRQDGTVACLFFSCAPIGGPNGGMRGVAQDATALDGQAATIAATLRRGEILDHVLWQMRQEVLAPRMMQVVLDELKAALGAEGCAVIDLLALPYGATLHHAGPPSEEAAAAAAMLLEAEVPDPVCGVAPDGRQLLACPGYTRFGERTGLALWRAPDARPWNAEDQVLVSSATAIVRVVLEHESIQREMSRQARTDPLTGLLNRRAFIDEMGRRIDRLDREGQPGTLMFVDLDNFKPLNDLWGHELGDGALALTATLLRAAVRPSDLVARLGGDEFAMWLDGSDELTAAERADALLLCAPKEFARLTADMTVRLSMSIGIACRQAGEGESVDSLLRRADRAMYEVKRTGRGHWLVSHAEPSI